MDVVQHLLCSNHRGETLFGTTKETLIPKRCSLRVTSCTPWQVAALGSCRWHTHEYPAICRLVAPVQSRSCMCVVVSQALLCCSKSLQTAADPHMRHLGGSRSASGVLPPRPHAEVFSARAADVVGATDALLARNPHALSSSSAAAAALLFDQQRLLMGLGVPPPAPPPAALFGNPLAGHQFAGQLDHAGLWAAAAAAATAPHHAAAAMVLPPAAASVVAAAAATRDPLVHPLHAYAQTRPVPGEAPSSAARALEGKTTSAFRQSPPPPPPPLHSSVMREGSDASAAAAAATREPRAAQQQTDVGEEDLLPEKAPSGAQTQGGGATDDIERKRHGVTSEEEEEREISMPDRKKARISTKPNS